MAFLKDIRTKIGEYLLFRENGRLNRVKSIINIDSAKTIGIIYPADKQGDVDLVKKYSDMLRTSGKNVTTLGFMNVKELPLGLNGSMQHQYFSLKELNWYFKPSSIFIESFIKEPFDILMDFDISWQLPVTFICSQSVAKCKAGRYSVKYENLFDVMIDTGENQNLEYYVKNVYSYMHLVNRKAS